MAKKRLADKIGQPNTNVIEVWIQSSGLEGEIQEAIDKWLVGGYVNSNCETKAGLLRAICTELNLDTPSPTRWNVYLEECRAKKENA